MNLGAPPWLDVKPEAVSQALGEMHLRIAELEMRLRAAETNADVARKNADSLFHSRLESDAAMTVLVQERELTERNHLVALLARIYPSGIRKTAIEGWDPCWHHCVFIDTPEGQLSWHYHDRDAELFAGLPPYTASWDGHTTPEKYERLVRLMMRKAKIGDGYREGFKLGYDAGRAQGRKDVEHLRGKMP